MVCIYCGDETHVTNSRPQRRINAVWRRRRCVDCGAEFTTTENVSYDTVWRVNARSGAVEPFQRDKLFLSLYKACEHRPTRLSDATGLTDTVVRKLQSQIELGQLSAKAIAVAAEVALSRFDASAATVYRAYHAG